MWRPERSAKETQTPFENPSKQKANGGKGEDNEKTQKAQDPLSSRWMNGGKNRNGALSRTAAWRAGRFWDQMEGTVKVFLQKGEKRTEVMWRNGSKEEVILV